ncbi:hypothetical protein JCM12298_30630 [Desulfothermus naphthae]
MKKIKRQIWGTRLSYACRYSIDCKMFGAYCFISEIKNAIPLLHGPVGCAFFPKLVPPDAIKTQLLKDFDPSPFPCTDLNEKDIIYGAEEKLYNAIIDVDKYYKPELIGVIISCPAAIIGDDVVSAVKRAKEKISADIIYTPSSAGFSDDERTDDFNRHAEDLIRVWKEKKKPKWGIEKCGRLDTMFSVISQLVEEPKEKIKRCVNIDTYGRFHWFEDLEGEIREIKAILKEIGISVNAAFPGCSVKEIKGLAKAELNFMRRSERSAIFMKERFGIDYIFDTFGNRYVGIDGAKSFYIDIGERFGLKEKAKKVVGEVERKLWNDLKETKKELNGKKIAYVCTPLYTTPIFIRLLEELGLRIELLLINTFWWRRWGMAKKTAKKVVKEFIESLNISSNPSIYTDLNIDEELDAIKRKEIDLVICDVLISDISRTMLYENSGIRSVSPHYMGYSSFRISFSQVKKLAEIILSALNSKPYKRDLIYFKYDYHKERFPTLISDIPDELRWERIMKHVWRGKER